MTRTRLSPLRLLALAGLFASVSSTALAGSPPTAAEKAMVEKVLARLSAVKTPPDMKWPPRLAFNDNDKEIQASASLDAERWPLVTVYVGLLRLAVKDKPDRLAFVVGHELGHHILGHVGPHETTDFKRANHGRKQELEADRFGVEWALKAGYSAREMFGFLKVMNELNAYSPVEGQGVDHPSWTDRAEAIDKDQAGLWRGMGAFDNGVYFLRSEQYGLAERCFRRVTKEFPKSYEGHANLGYALLMEYADALEPAELGKFNIGQILVGGFYRRAGSIESQVRGGTKDELWTEAVAALEQALSLKPDLALAKANLGVAWLIRPAGRDAQKAAKYLEQAEALIGKDTTLDPITRAAVTINLAVARGAAGAPDRLAAGLDQAEAAMKKSLGGAVDTSSVTPAITFNRALSLAQSTTPDRRQAALAEFQRYLRGTAPDSTWWSIAYDRYSQLCDAAGVAKEDRAKLAGSSPVKLRPVMMEIGGKPLSVGEPLSDVQKRLGAGEVVPTISGTNLVTVLYRAQGVRVLAGDRVLAVVAFDPVAPPVGIRSSGLGSKTEMLKVGMSREDLERIIPDTPDYGTFLDPEVNYRFYPQLGLAVRVQKGHVAELVVMQIPRTGSL